ncbi:HlyD family type I secretion periplasmic adaptor subunit [Rhizobium cauense]|uniref:HlyD family type I secretion periplasmic adaptor subunit n=1 Tax=Rhizobium cauense TaxID=1166683 RepID=UPI001C6DEBF5|nr:HlyD family type I secretion periplasmic adaptor subunit [Rhizobium cauense]MBW9116615.1 HlyD family type I secretion periplasmic adaptor subunit [Rhizobium cauense]
MITTTNDKRSDKIKGDTDKARHNARQFGITSRIVVSSILAGTLVFGVGGWAAQAKLSGAVITHGQVTVSEQVKTIQHRDGGIIAEIRVDNGTAVKKGDVLLVLDDTQTRVELSIVKAQLQQLTAAHARLVAERDAADGVGFEALDLASSVVAGETKLFEENRRMVANQKEQLRLQIVQLDEQVRGFEAQSRSNDSEAEIVEQELAKTEKLLANKLVPISQKRDLLRQRARIEGSRGELIARVAEAEGEISELNMKLISIDQTTRKEAQTEIVSLVAKIAELNEREIAARDRLTRMEVRAPVDGFVYDLQVHTIGGIITSGATVMSVVPKSGDLIVEVRIPPVDIDRVAPGQPARMRFTAFNQRTTPELHGKVEVVAAATTQDRATGQPYYLASLSLADKDLLKDNKLIPGMPVEVFVQTEERTAMSYILKPFTDQMMKAFREE